MRVFLFIWFLLNVVLCPAEQFLYKHRAGDTYRILSTVHEDVYLNRRLAYSGDILNRIAAKVTKVQEERGYHEVVFQTAERVDDAQGVRFQFDHEYYSEFDRDKYGRINIDKSYFMPVVRNVPVFPNRDLKVGERWNAQGHEMHDFRESFGIAEPYQIPFDAHYQFLGEKKWKEKAYPTFSVSYRIFYEPPQVSGTVYPLRIMGASDQIVYWDSAIGQPVSYTEEFRMVFELSDGTVIEYRGTAQAQVIESEIMDKEQLVSDISTELDRLGLEAEVTMVEGGIKINLENIQFRADRAVFLPGEEKKLEQIGRILSLYADRDILIEGHTAYSGSEESQLSLSQERADAVADYMIKNQIRSSERIITKGYGASRPIADNNTEAGKQKNRRVEITILEN
ncbi:MAG: OmpA family protein [Spirochaetaceae bacterium]|jgi:outer membrane protein OmpA-like peptidoglycan-associated protein|nr:OmpA family protein [Spirochaetaceae bacterium]